MKKISVLVALIGIVAISCSKKEDKAWQDSNTMLAEPEAAVKDSATTITVDQGDAAATTEAPAGAPAPKTDSAAAK